MTDGKFELGDREPRFIYDREQMALVPVRSDDEWERGEPRQPESNTVPTNPQENYPDADIDYKEQARAKDSANPIEPMGSKGDGTNTNVGTSTTQPPPDGPPAKQAPVPNGGKIDGPVIDKREIQHPQEAGKVNPPQTSPGLVSTKDKK